MKIFLLTIIFFALLQGSAFSQQIQWQKSFGGTLREFANSIQQTADGGYIVAGTTESNDGDVSGNHGDIDYWVVKLNSSGDTLWTKSLGGSFEDVAYSIQQTADGGYVVAGATDSNDGDVSGNHSCSTYSRCFDFWVVKLDSSGNITWQQCLGGSYREEAKSIQQTSDGGYIVVGNTNSNDGDVTGFHGSDDLWVVKLNSNGFIQWQKCYGSINIEEGTSVQQTADGGYIVAGISISGWPYGSAIWAVKLNSSGDSLWSQQLGSIYGAEGTSIQQTSDGGYILAGNINFLGGYNSDFLVVKLNSSGDSLWSQQLGGSSWEIPYSIQQTLDGGYIVAGYTESNDGDVSGNHGNRDYWVVKLEGSGNILWQKCLGGTSVDYAKSIQQTTDGGYIVAGTSYSNNGDVTGNHGMYDFWVVKLDSITTTSVVDIQDNISVIQVYPNPNNGSFTLQNTPDNEVMQLEIYNLLGELLYTDVLAPMSVSHVVNIPQIESGLYVAVVSGNGIHTAVKFIVE